MRIDQRKKWYQKIKYNKNFKIVSFITIILVCVVGYMMITARKTDIKTIRCIKNKLYALAVARKDKLVSFLREKNYFTYKKKEG